MKCVSIKEGRIIDGISLMDGKISIGNSYDSRHVSVTIPEGATVEGETLVALTGPSTSVLVLFYSQHGYRGQWTLRGNRSQEDWDRAIRGEEELPDQPHGLEILAEGYSSDSPQGALGCGPVYLAIMKHGQAIEIVRYGRLYGEPSVIRLENKAGLIVRSIPKQEAEERLVLKKLLEVTGNDDAVAVSLGWGGGGTHRSQNVAMANRPFLRTKEGKEVPFLGVSITEVCEILRDISLRSGSVPCRYERFEVALAPGVTYVGDREITTSETERI